MVPNLVQNLVQGAKSGVVQNLVQGTKFSTGNLFITYTGARSSKKTYVNAFASVNQTGSKRRFSLNDPNAFGRLGQPCLACLPSCFLRVKL